MWEISIYLFMLPLLCCSKDKNLPTTQTNEKFEQAKQMHEPALEIQDFLCNEEQIAMYKDKASCEEAARSQNKARHEAYLRKEYRLKELEARYKDIFKKTPPMCKKCEECDIVERNSKIEICIYGLMNALAVGIPYPTPPDDIWFLNIYSLDKEGYLTRLKFYGENEYPPNWDKFKKTIDDMVEKMKKKRGGGGK